MATDPKRGNGYTLQQAAAHGFTATKTARQMALDISRRFLPAYIPLWKEQSQRVKDTETRERLSEATARELGEIVGKQPSVTIQADQFIFWLWPLWRGRG